MHMSLLSHLEAPSALQSHPFFSFSVKRHEPQSHSVESCLLSKFSEIFRKYLHSLGSPHDNGFPGSHLVSGSGCSLRYSHCGIPVFLSRHYYHNLLGVDKFY